MLKQRVSTTGGHLPPVDTTSGASVGFVAVDSAANESQFKANGSHDRRMRRQRRSERLRHRVGQGWTVSLW